MNERCDRLAVQQAEAAKTQPGYWTSGGNPIRQESGDITTQPERPTHVLVPGSSLPDDERITAVETTKQPTPGPQEKNSDYHAGYADGYERGRTVAEDRHTSSNETEPNTAQASGYEACRQELFQFLSNLTSGPPPSFGDYVSGFNDCRRELLEFQSRMKYNDLPF